ncbi:MAG: endonuclease III [bacterium]
MAEKMTEKADIVFRGISSLFPEARCELNHGNQLELLIAVMLSAQTTDIAVNAVTANLFARYHDVADFAAAPLADLEDSIRHLGLFKTKAKNIQAVCRIIRDAGGTIPNDQHFLESLPGVGRKTANVFLSEWYHVPRIAVDTHVRRVAYRLGFATKNDDPAKVEQNLMTQFAMDQWIDLHHKMVIFGRYFCKAKRPECQRCPFVSFCTEPQIPS